MVESDLIWARDNRIEVLLQGAVYEESGRSDSVSASVESEEDLSPFALRSLIRYRRASCLSIKKAPGGGDTLPLRSRELSRVAAAAEFGCSFAVSKPPTKRCFHFSSLAEASLEPSEVCTLGRVSHWIPLGRIAAGAFSPPRPLRCFRLSLCRQNWRRSLDSQWMSSTVC